MDYNVVNKIIGGNLMGYYLKSIVLTKDMLGDATRKLKYLSSFTAGDSELNIKLTQKFPISAFGNLDDDLKIKGAKALINGFDEIDSEKIDIISKYNDIVFEGVNQKKQLVFSLPNEGIEAHSIYDFYSDFLDLFDITKYTSYCIRNDYNTIIQKNIDWLLKKNGEKEKWFRLLKDEDDTWGIRGLTSTNYKKYDNGIVIYLSLLALHKYSCGNDKSYHIDYAHISDSSLSVFFEQDEAIDIPDVGKVYLGLAITNGEIRNLTFKAELRYRIENNNTSFAGIFHSPIFSIVHSMNVETIDKHLENLFHIEEQEKGLISFVRGLNTSVSLSEDIAYLLIREFLEKIKDCSDITKKTKEEFKKLETEKLINNTYNIIDLFGKLDAVSTDVDERVFIERIYHKVILDIFKE